MKAIKDCEWSVKVDGSWWACTTDYNGSDASFKSEKKFTRNRNAKRNWEKFARLNKIKKWRYV